jgi:DNA-binding LytR/AlgR family response regulator
VLAVNSEDHYVRLYTDRTDQLVAMRFADALSALALEDGLQVHRRWWVATQAVESISKEGEGLQLRLRNGLKVPVSRSFAQQVRKAWLDRSPD